MVKTDWLVSDVISRSSTSRRELGFHGYDLLLSHIRFIASYLVLL
jgi:hypothetical protein